MRGVRSLLAKLAPASIEAELGNPRRRTASGMQIGPFRYKTLWELYAEIYGDFAEDEKQAFMLIFGPEFVHAYSELAGDAPAVPGGGGPSAPNAFPQNFGPPPQHAFPQAPPGRNPSIPPGGFAPPPMVTHPPVTHPPQPGHPNAPPPPPAIVPQPPGPSGPWTGGSWPGGGPPRR
jgi:hypothetical protein